MVDRSEITGGCLCGECRYVADAEPINVRACHCRICQMATGAPLYARVLVPLDSVQIEGPVAWFASSADLRRRFCSRCGSTMFSERASGNVIGLTMGTLNNPDAFRPSEHIWTSSKQAWLVLCGDLPAPAEGPPA